MSSIGSMKSDCPTRQPSSGWQRLSAGDTCRLTYWKYIRVDELLALCSPLTLMEDERQFIFIHQVAEIHLAMILHELEQLTGPAPLPASQWVVKLRRINAVCRLFIQNIKALEHCIDRDQFLGFRDALAPASGFQSFQYRKMELMSARLADLVLPATRVMLGPDPNPELLFEHLYWREVVSTRECPSEGTMLHDFEARYLNELREVAFQHHDCNLAARFSALAAGGREDRTLVCLLRGFDRLINCGWRGVHQRLALALLADDAMPRMSTGGTEWREYLSRANRSVRFFPELVDAAR